MSRETRLYLEDILEAARNVLEFVKGLTFDQFEADKAHQHAVFYNLFVIGEAVRSIPDSVQTQHPHVEWRRINALRNLLAHVYFAINLATIWDIVTDDVPQLIEDIQTILDDLDGTEGDSSAE